MAETRGEIEARCVVCGCSDHNACVDAVAFGMEGTEGGGKGTMKREVFVCDVCYTERVQTNHWFAVVTIEAPRRLIIGPLGSEVTIVGVGENKQVAHLCGEACVAKKVSEFLGAK